MDNREEKKTIWIIRYSDQSMRSKYGTRKEAEQDAEKYRPEGETYLII
ncbi:MAG: hypothetical protein MRZ74_07335 [Blautia sp.]|nr:hypothetical protein [Blautia sp.]